MSFTEWNIYTYLCLPFYTWTRRLELHSKTSIAMAKTNFTNWGYMLYDIEVCIASIILLPCCTRKEDKLVRALGAF